MRMRIHGMDMDKMRHFNEFFASYLRFCVLEMKYNVVVLIIHNISYTAICVQYGR
jgi:hypothetical protein